MHITITIDSVWDGIPPCLGLLMIVFVLIIGFYKVGMGSSDSKSEQQSVQDNVQNVEIPTDPLINRLRNAFRLKPNATNPKMTNSFLFAGFAQQITRTNSSRIDQNNSPFCYAMIKDVKSKEEEIVTCVVISPIMALVAAKSICDDNGFIFHKTLVLHCCPNKKWVQKVVKKMVAIKNSKLVLLFLQEPIWELGWSGATFLEQSSEMNDLPMFRIVYELEKKEDQAKTSRKVRQMISRVYFKDLGNFKGKALRSEAGLVFTIRERKTYIVGVQKGDECTFFDVFTLKDMREKVEQFLSPEREREYLKMIDIEQMEIQTSW